MEQPPGSVDDLQPSDVSNIPSVVDLTKKGEDCVLSSMSLNTLRMVKGPGWYPNPGTADPETSGVALQPADPIQPDDAFSHTTVTLSYVSRSHVFSTHDSLPPPRYSKFSLHPENRLGGSDRLQNQPEEPVNLAAHTRPFHSSQAPVGPEDSMGGRVAQNPLELNGRFAPGHVHVKSPPQVQEELLCLENGDGPPSPEPPAETVDEDEDEVLFVKEQDGARADLRSLTRDFRSPLEDPVSPSATSLDGVEDVFVLPEASSSPSAGNSHLEDVCVSDPAGNGPNGVVAHVNGSAETLDRTRKRALRSGGGTRLEAIVMNINSSRYNVSGCILSSKKPHKSSLDGPDHPVPAQRTRNKVKSTFSVKKVKLKLADGADSTRDSELADTLKKSHTKTPPFTEPEPEPPQTKRKSSSQSSPEEMSKPSPSKSPKDERGQTQRCPTASRSSKRRRRVQTASMFSPKEPEIKLRYVGYKEERRDSRSDGFSPFVRVQRLPASLCTVINDPEQLTAERRQPGRPGGFLSAAVPGTSCLQPGRPSVHGQHRRPLVCCLCGRSANAIDLGDLHGPYYPEHRPAAKAASSTAVLKDDEDDFSDSDSSLSSVPGRGRAVPSRTLGPGAGGPAVAEDWYSPPVLPVEPGEYWLHEDCGVWTAGVYLVKGKVYGLEEAVRVSKETVTMLNTTTRF